MLMKLTPDRNKVSMHFTQFYVVRHLRGSAVREKKQYEEKRERERGRGRASEGGREEERGERESEERGRER